MRCQFCGEVRAPMFQLACGRPLIEGHLDGPLEVHFNVQVCGPCGGEKRLNAEMDAHLATCAFHAPVAVEVRREDA